LGRGGAGVFSELLGWGAGVFSELLGWGAVARVFFSELLGWGAVARVFLASCWVGPRWRGVVGLGRGFWSTRTRGFFEPFHIRGEFFSKSNARFLPN